jgi:hypothetical protein
MILEWTRIAVELGLIIVAFAAGMEWRGYLLAVAVTVYAFVG